MVRRIRCFAVHFRFMARRRARRGFLCAGLRGTRKRGQSKFQRPRSHSVNCKLTRSNQFLLRLTLHFTMGHNRFVITQDQIPSHLPARFGRRTLAPAESLLVMSLRKRLHELIPGVIQTITRIINGQRSCDAICGWRRLSFETNHKDHSVNLPCPGKQRLCDSRNARGFWK
jgi:hypothetical protein